MRFTAARDLVPGSTLSRDQGLWLRGTAKATQEVKIGSAKVKFSGFTRRTALSNSQHWPDRPAQPDLAL